MRIGLLITSIGNFGQKGFYNAQEIGLAKELDKLFDEVIVYKAVPISEKKNKSLIKGCKHSILYQIPVKSKGINGVWDCSIMDSNLDALVYFSDTQLAVPRVYRWCCENNIVMYPYIGVVESHSSSKLKKIVIDKLFKRNIQVYKKCTCFAKTPTVLNQLDTLAVKSSVLMPVGLDLTLLHEEYEKVSKCELKNKYGYLEEDKVLLFIGRLIEEKQPIRMLDILNEIRKKDQSYKLLMVGTGEQENIVKGRIKELSLEDCVQLVVRIPNKDIWELYCLADAFVNLNQHEIFGMAILEAMYYGCKVVAWKAPGPNLIIENKISGYIATSNQEIEDFIINKNLSKSVMKRRILDHFTWCATAEKISDVVREYSKKYYGIYGQE